MTLENNLQHEKVIHLDLNKFTAVERDTSVKATIAKMRADANHCAIVTDNGTLIGIFTDREFSKKLSMRPKPGIKP